VSFGLTGVLKGELGAAWAWSDDDEEDKAAIQKEPIDVEVSEK
jgi:hypothetical protein